MAHHKSCSFASDGKCFLTTYTKVQTLRGVSADEIELLSLRSKLSPTTIHDICSHHEQLLVVKFSGLQRKCCNAFEQHKTSKPRTKSLRTITQELRMNALKVGISLVPGEKLCSPCRTCIHNLVRTHELASQDSDNEGEVHVDHSPSTSCMASEVVPEPISTSLTESTSDETASVIHVLDEDASHILESLQQTPVKLRKFMA